MVTKSIQLFILSITILALILLLTCCDFSDNKLTVANMTHDSIAFIIPAEPNYFPTEDDSKDIRINQQVNDSLMNGIAMYDPAEEAFGGVHFLAGDSAKQLLTFNIKWEQIIDDTPGNILAIKFVPAIVMTSGRYTWKEIYDQKMFKEQFWTKEDLEKQNWRVEYRN